VAYEVFIHKKAERKLDKIREAGLKGRLTDAFRLLSEPFSLDTVKMEDEENTYRTRIGRYRILWVLDNEAVCIVDFDTREKAYKGR
jgi:mRNA interferase RelE/StbE